MFMPSVSGTPRTSMAAPGHKRQGCLFYIYAFFFGLGTGIIALVSLGDLHAAAITWVLMSFGVILGLATCMTHAYLTCHGSDTTLGLYKRALLDISGLSLASAVTFCGVFTHITKELFFLCGIFSASCYLVATIALTVNLYLIYQNKSATLEEGEACPRDGTYPRTINVFENIAMLTASVPGAMVLQSYCDNSMTCYSETNWTYSHAQDRVSQRSEPRGVSVISGRGVRTEPVIQMTSDLRSLQRDQRDHDSVVTQLAVHGLAPNLSLPSYTEVTSSSPHSPPKYSEISTSEEVLAPPSCEDPLGSTGQALSDQEETVGQNTDSACQDCDQEHSDQPPQYHEINNHS